MALDVKKIVRRLKLRKHESPRYTIPNKLTSVALKGLQQEFERQFRDYSKRGFVFNFGEIGFIPYQDDIDKSLRAINYVTVVESLDPRTQPEDHLYRRLRQKIPEDIVSSYKGHAGLDVGVANTDISKAVTHKFGPPQDLKGIIEAYLGVLKNPILPQLPKPIKRKLKGKLSWPNNFCIVILNGDDFNPADFETLVNQVFTSALPTQEKAVLGLASKKGINTAYLAQPQAWFSYDPLNHVDSITESAWNAMTSEEKGVVSSKEVIREVFLVSGCCCGVLREIWFNALERSKQGKKISKASLR